MIVEQEWTRDLVAPRRVYAGCVSENSDPPSFDVISCLRTPQVPDAGALRRALAAACAEWFGTDSGLRAWADDVDGADMSGLDVIGVYWASRREPEFAATLGRHGVVDLDGESAIVEGRGLWPADTRFGWPDAAPPGGPPAGLLVACAPGDEAELGRRLDAVRPLRWRGQLMRDPARYAAWRAFATDAEAEAFLPAVREMAASGLIVLAELVHYGDRPGPPEDWRIAWRWPGPVDGPSGA